MSKTTYIYLNEYPNGYLYVGSHSWNGEGLDPNYQGSSHIAKLYHWKPSKITILQTLDNPKEQLHIEGEVIYEYCSKFGVARIAKVVANKNGNFWVDKFKDGLMLNCQANNLAHAVHNSHTEEACKKRTETRKENGALQKWVKSTHTKEAILKMLEKRKKDGSLLNFQRAGCTEEATLKSLRTRIDNGSYDKWQEAAHKQDYKNSHLKASMTRKGQRNNRYAVKCGEFEGNLREVLVSVFGHFRYECGIGRKFKNGVSIVEKEGYKFELIYIS